MTDIQPAKLGLEIIQGATFTKTIYWSTDLVGKAISAVTAGIPTVFTSAAHGLPTQRVLAWFQGMSGMSELDARANEIGKRRSAVAITKVSSNTFSAVVNTTGETYGGGGVFYYNAPLDLTGFTGRMQIRPSVKSDTTLVSLTTENGGMTLDSGGGIALLISSTATAALTFTKGVYDLELVNGSTVYRLVGGDITVSPEVTR
jgi:hypothetical protein